MGRKELDPVTFEILRYRVEEIVAEMYYAIGRVSGNPIIFEAGDHQESILDADGESVMFGGGIVEWTYSLEAGVKHIVKQYEVNPGIYDGDQFILNHAYVAAVHAMDVQLIAPVFWEGKRVAWVVAAGHQSDVGGMNEGSFCYEAEEIYQEGLQIPGLKIMEGGIVRKDVEETIRAMVRTPDMCMLDIYSKIATNNGAKARLLEMIECYGLNTIMTLFDQMRRYSEEKVRARLREIPDGEWSHVVCMEGLREPYIKVAVTIIKEGDSLTMDFTGSSPQSTGSQNIAKIGTISNAFCPFLTLLCHDIPWTGGVYRPVSFVIPEGTVVNPRWPAATSHNTSAGAGLLTISTVHGAISKMLLSNEKTRHEAFACAGGAQHCPISWGINRDGTHFVFQPMDSLGGGMGGSVDKDGFNSGANMWTPKTQLVNLETNELLFPLLFIGRREIPDTGGVGKFRGGITQATAFIPWDLPERKLNTFDHGFGSEPRMSTGLGGGYPAPNVQAGIIRNSDILERLERGEFPSNYQEIRGEVEYLRTGEHSTVGERDVVFYYQSGGGGYGDPIERDPRLVVKDVKSGCVSLSAAEELYGVILDPETVEIDLGKTEERRQQIIKERLKVGEK